MEISAYMLLFCINQFGKSNYLPITSLSIFRSKKYNGWDDQRKVQEVEFKILRHVPQEFENKGVLFRKTNDQFNTLTIQW